MNRKDKIRLLTLLREKDKRESLKDYKGFAKRNIFITNKKGEKVNLIHNTIQTRINNKIAELRAAGIPPRIVILKARQEGVSTNEQGRMICETTQKSNRNALIVAHKDDSTKAIFEKAKYMFDHLPNDVKPLQRASNAKELIFDIPTHYKGDEEGLNSKIVVQVAGDTGIGRSETYHYTHLSEFAFWKGSNDKSPIKQLQGIMQSIPNIIDSLVVIESTANGFNDFKEIWDKAVSEENGFVPMFFAWYDHDEYIISFETELDKQRFIETMTEYEIYLQDNLKLPLERINWWRWALKNNCGGDINMMKQENPSTAEEAFIMSGSPVFDNEKIMQYIEVLRKKYETNPYKEGYFEFKWHDPEWKDYIEDKTIKFVESKTKNWIRIYKEPEQDIPYVLAGDTKGEGKDYFAGTLANNITQERQASVHIQLTNSKPYTWQMYCLGKYYNEALIGIEMNWNTGPLEELERLRYPNQYVREIHDSFTGQIKKAYGWRTDRVTRPLMIDDEVTLTEDYLHLIKDIPTLQEMITFVYDENNRPDAMSGKHDDLLISDMILNQIRSQQKTRKLTNASYTLDKLPYDLREDYNNANQKGKDYLIKKWTKEGII